MKKLVLICSLFGVIVCGCMHIVIEKNDPLLVPKEYASIVTTNAYGKVEYHLDGGYCVSLWDWGFWLHITNFKVVKQDDKISVAFGEAAVDLSTNTIILAEKPIDVINALKTEQVK